MNKIINCVCGSKIRVSTTPHLQQKCPFCGFIHEYIEFEEIVDRKSFEVNGKYIGMYNKRVKYGKRKR